MSDFEFSLYPLIRLNTFKQVSIAIILIVFLILSPLLAEELSFFGGDTSISDASKESFADLLNKNSDSSYRGVVTGNIIGVDPRERYLFIRPKEQDLPRMYIYVDPRTRFTLSKLGLKKRTRFGTAIEGHRIAARVFMRQGVIVADEVFFVEGDFEPHSRYERKVFKKAAPKTPEKAEGGGH